MPTPDSHWWPALRLAPNGEWRRDSLRQRLIGSGDDSRQGVLCWEGDGKEWTSDDVWKYKAEPQRT